MSSRNDEACGNERGRRPADDHVSRRAFLKLSGAGAAGVAFGATGIRPMAGPFPAELRADHLVPADKKLTPDWLASLRSRGIPEVWSGDDLKHIGMPVGGVCCGQLYLGGDGRLWYWDIFRSQYSSNYGGMSSGIHYADPPEPASPVEQGFAVRISTVAGSEVRRLDGKGFRDITFRGEYPIGRVSYRDEVCPIEVDLEAFSPFVPLDHDESALPASILHFRIRNTSFQSMKVTLAGWLQNAVCPDHRDPELGVRVNRAVERQGRTTLSCTVEPVARDADVRPAILFADFEGESWEGWTVEGTAFGESPFAKADMQPYHDVSGHVGERVANSHHTRGGETVGEGDDHTGKLTSEPFTIERRFVNFRIGGGRHPGRTCINLVVDGEVVCTATGHDANRMRTESFTVHDLEGRKAHLEIVDAQPGPWGNIGIDHIVFADESVVPELEELPGFGSMALSVVDPDPHHAWSRVRPDVGSASLPDEAFLDFGVFFPEEPDRPDAMRLFDTKPIGTVERTISLGPREETEITFVLSWWFPYYPDPSGEFAGIQDIERLNRHYENRFTSASAVAGYVVRHLDRLVGDTRRWNRTWYDSTLPYWFLDRTFVAIDCLATQTCHWFDNGRFWGWEGINCCPGTCQHVWNYAQGLARIFPPLERITRERVDYGLSFQESGELWYRGECARHVAHDGQCGTILRAYREHLTAPDDAYLKRIWTRVRKSIEFLIEQDGGEDGLLEGRQYNTLDQAWYGPMAWISSMYVAALRAGEAMAGAVGDDAFAARCREIAQAGTKNIASVLFDGEYFIHLPDPEHPEGTNTNDGCHIDQALGQSFAWQVGLPRILPKEQTASALRSLWKYNFAPDAGGYRNAMQDVIAGGRWYAMPGEAGLLMCTWPKGGADRAAGEGASWAVGYFNECMTGFEYSVASHMIWEGEPDSELVTRGLAVTRAIHDRYHASLRNPYNEIECSDHYSRAMAGYGVFLAACGFEYDGPRRHIGFAPRLSPDDFRAAFTAAEGWGSLSQVRAGGTQRSTVEVRWGRLRVETVALELPRETRVDAIRVDGITAVQKPDEDHLVELRPRHLATPAEWQQDRSRVLVTLPECLTLETAESLDIEIDYRD